MSAPYTVTWADRAGPAGDKEFDTFDNALDLYRLKNSVGFIANIYGDGAEFDGERWFDGLTDEERDSL